MTDISREVCKNEISAASDRAPRQHGGRKSARLTRICLKSVVDKDDDLRERERVAVEINGVGVGARGPG